MVASSQYNVLDDQTSTVVENVWDFFCLIAIMEPSCHHITKTIELKLQEFRKKNISSLLYDLSNLTFSDDICTSSTSPVSPPSLTASWNDELFAPQLMFKM